MKIKLGELRQLIHEATQALDVKKRHGSKTQRSSRNVLRGVQRNLIKEMVYTPGRGDSSTWGPAISSADPRFQSHDFQGYKRDIIECEVDGELRVFEDVILDAVDGYVTVVQCGGEATDDGGTVACSPDEVQDCIDKAGMNSTLYDEISAELADVGAELAVDDTLEQRYGK